MINNNLLLINRNKTSSFYKFNPPQKSKEFRKRSSLFFAYRRLRSDNQENRSCALVRMEDDADVIEKFENNVNFSVDNC